MRPVHLLILSSELPPAGYGSAAALGQFLQGAAQYTDWNVEVIAPATIRPDVQPKWRGVQVRRTRACDHPDGRWHSKWRLACYPLDAVVRAGPANSAVTLVMSWQALPAGLAGSLLAKRFKVPHVVRLHGPEIAARPVPVVGALSCVLRRVLRGADAVVIKSEQDAKALRAVGYDGESRLIRNVEAFRPATARTGGAVRLPIRLLVVSRLVPRKCVQTALDALRLLGTRCPGQFVMTIAGDGPLRDALGQRAAATGLPVVFLGRVASERMPALYAGHDLLVHPSEQESSCNAALEAVAASLAVIGRTSALRDVVRHGVTGILLEEMSAPALANVLADGRWRGLPTVPPQQPSLRSSREYVQEFGALFASLSPLTG